MTLLYPSQNRVKLEFNDGQKYEWGNGTKWVLFAGPDIFEDYGLVKEVSTELKKITERNQIPWILKCSFDKANRTSSRNFRGPGQEQALKGLEKIKSELNVPILSDVHETSQVDEVLHVVDVIQIPAFLCRQTDLVKKAARSGKVLNIKKGQFLSPWEMKSVVEKAFEEGNKNILVCERGTSFGYNRLINDMTGLVEMREQTGCPVIMDATHSVQLPGGLGSSSGGRREMIETLARAAMAVGVDGFFFETHPNPDKALCDGPNSIELSKIESVLVRLNSIWNCIQNKNF
jgi:2-dehydro-3-deoxyphosphooctonate aldolase (KDO 8-P synthase)